MAINKIAHLSKTWLITYYNDPKELVCVCVCVCVCEREREREREAPKMH